VVRRLAERVLRVADATGVAPLPRRPTLEGPAARVVHPDARRRRKLRPLELHADETAGHGGQFVTTMFQLGLHRGPILWRPCVRVESGGSSTSHSPGGTTRRLERAPPAVHRLLEESLSDGSGRAFSTPAASASSRRQASGRTSDRRLARPPSRHRSPAGAHEGTDRRRRDAQGST
jgi:hypothetical protein